LHSFSSNPSLEFVAAPALKPAEVEIDPAQMQQYEKELAEAAAAPLPDEVRILGSYAERFADLFICHYRMTTSRGWCCHDLMIFDDVSKYKTVNDYT
jgi:hypothetical protein